MEGRHRRRANTTSITLTGLLEANSVTVNATKDYVFAGTGDLTGLAGLTKSGSAKLTLSNANPVSLGTNAGHLALGYTAIADAKLTYTVEGRDDLAGGAWSTVAAANNPYNPGVAGPVTVQDTVTFATQPRRFLRLTVTLAP